MTKKQRITKQDFAALQDRAESAVHTIQLRRERLLFWPAADRKIGRGTLGDYNGDGQAMLKMEYENGLMASERWTKAIHELSDWDSMDEETQDDWVDAMNDVTGVEGPSGESKLRVKDFKAVKAGAIKLFKEARMDTLKNWGGLPVDVLPWDRSASLAEANFFVFLARLADSAAPEGEVAFWQSVQKGLKSDPEPTLIDALRAHGRAAPSFDWHGFEDLGKPAGPDKAKALAWIWGPYQSEVSLRWRAVHAGELV